MFISVVHRIFLVSIFFGVSLVALSQETEKPLKIIGMVTDVDNSPLKGALVFVDYKQLNTKTNKRGVFKIKLDQEHHVLSVYLPSKGILSKEVKGQLKIDFKFTTENKPISKDELIKLGFQLYKDPQKNTDWYADFSSILEILDKRFYNVRVIDGEIIIGKGANRFNGDKTPLILVDGRPTDVYALTTIPTTDVKLIRVISRGSEASQYGGLKSSNGVILITLKN